MAARLPASPPQPPQGFGPQDLSPESHALVSRAGPFRERRSAAPGGGPAGRGAQSGRQDSLPASTACSRPALFLLI